MASFRDFSYATFPTAREVTSNASSTATPAPIRAEKVRVKRAIATFLTIGPTAGTLMMIL